MKKYLPLIGLCCLVVLLAACSTRVEEAPAGFRIDSWSSGIGGTNPDNLEGSVFSYTLYISSKTEDLQTITQVIPIIGEKIVDRIISNEPPQLVFHNGYIEVSGQFIYDTKGLSKEQIIIDLHPQLVSVKIITEQVVELLQHDEFAEWEK